VAVAVQVEGAFSYAVPGPKGIMAEHKGGVVDRDFRVTLHAHPVKAQHCRRIVVSDNEMLSPIQKRKYSGRDVRRSREVAKVPNLMFASYSGVPPFRHGRVHLLDRIEWAFGDIQNPMISKVGIRGEENGHGA
jgi:hypothetical protein